MSFSSKIGMLLCGWRYELFENGLEPVESNEGTRPQTTLIRSYQSVRREQIWYAKLIRMKHFHSFNTLWGKGCAINDESA